MVLRADETRAAIALLPTEDCANRARRLGFELDDEFATGFAAAALPPHVSLKQPFEIYDLGSLEAYFDELATRIEPFSVAVGRLLMWRGEGSEQGTLVLSIETSRRLRAIHRQLNEELPEALGHPTPARFDGDDFQFHLTVALAIPSEACRQFEEATIDEPLGWPCPLEALAMFIYRRTGGTWRWMTYKTAALAREPSLGD